MLTLKTREDLQRLVDEGLQESLTLEYKASAALTRDSLAIKELCKDVSALANSAGGQIVYGIEETKGQPSRVDDGVADPKITREWIVQILNSRIQPRIQGVQVERVELGPSRYGYVISVPSTQTGPHQAQDDQKYYRRFELQAVPMYDHEIRDVMGRATNPALVGDFHFAQMRRWHDVEFEPLKERSKTIALTLSITNSSVQPAMYAVVSVFMDERLPLDGRGPYDRAGQSINDDRIKQYVLRLKMSADSFFPIFKEAPIMLPAFGFCVHERMLSMDQKFAIAYEIRAPGCFKYETGYIALQNGRLSLHMPSHADFQLNNLQQPLLGT